MAGSTRRVAPDRAEFAIISFEGPDEYARAGGLAVRVRDLAETLAAEGFRTHLFFIGDPALPSIEERGNLTLHRWSQWISQHHPGGVYDGEQGKVDDLSRSLPPVLLHDIAVPAAQVGKVTVLMGEDWQTVGAMQHASYLFHQFGLGPRLIPVWTANNIFGFHGINFGQLQAAAAVMTVSRYMKHEMWVWGVNPLVCPNGIAPSALVKVPAATVRKLRKAFNAEVALFKIGRYTPDKRWIMAMEAVAVLKHMGARARILVRGDKSPYGGEVLGRAYSMGLVVGDLRERYNSVDELIAAIAAIPDADVLNLTAFLPDGLVPAIYASVDGVLANSGHEPFGLVGLEVMGAGGLAFVGATGEDYAEDGRNAVVVDTDDPREIVVQLRRLRDDPELAHSIKRAGKATANEYVWPRVLEQLLTKLEFVALARGVELGGDG